jgi:hypothetical protein
MKSVITHLDMTSDDDKEVEDSAKRELLEWRNIRITLSPVKSEEV